ncbi:MULTISPECIES: hypothetical protein [Cyanophyceae]|jgi:DNA repair exonuclease SbcCD ATPase subunit|uniref:hypothetical protein n=1 Tax=Cyanophyceae TaxID=3028117 RepID=UPI001689A34B|nr:hypothetical protein [Trichocoleus sp. FACHB-69]MBD1932126.1 hypothetical protein [Trichocoleus sp. FACHB-69]
MEPLQAEIDAIRSQLEALKQERESLKVDPVLPSYDSPEAIVEAYRRHARETSQMSAEIKGIDDAIAALEAKLKQLVGQPLELLQRQRKQNSLEQQLDEDKQRAQGHAERINDLAAELAEEVQALKAIADEISTDYWQLHGKPFITGFSRVTVPHVRSDGAVWTIVNKVV